MIKYVFKRMTFALDFEVWATSNVNWMKHFSIRLFPHLKFHSNVCCHIEQILFRWKFFWMFVSWLCIAIKSDRRLANQSVSLWLDHHTVCWPIYSSGRGVYLEAYGISTGQNVWIWRVSSIKRDRFMCRKMHDFQWFRWEFSVVRMSELINWVIRSIIRSR